MKINWGTGIVIAFVGFISFILFFVIRMTTSHNANHDLVTEEYYKAELGYQKEIDAEQNALNASEQIELKKSPDGLLVIFPEGYDNTNVSGNVSLYRPSNKHLDFNLPLSLSNSHLLIPDKRLLDGRWDITISWKHQGKDFMHKESITF
ncbi:MULTISPECIES: FixH family protein [Zobellia]|uniref:FixH-like protein n=1 Tax=Zobellia galactanivorans (strain DSM 12802 / CCUG 47099 / CIP 106680 / NCIMB 13871 / Dsij) TaxID=63186 RepID=G0L5P9_ZOBGA|nr:MULTISPECIES: FixH family protein [Zobellia]MBU3026193.1 FixH family protein [Zobellia galactanivorans]OWW27270.1 cytochrome C oxidase Cbb3 [Zobellia sp. OII3]CAZ96409.1 FixH-like protein [Zobellia galactanivorans]